jgi:hypothetical protein
MGLLIEGSIFYQLWAGVNARRTVQASAAALPAKPGVCDGCFRSCNTWRLALPRGHIRVRRLGTIARTSPRRGLCPYQRADRGMANSQSGHRPVAEVTDAQRETRSSSLQRSGKSMSGDVQQPRLLDDLGSEMPLELPRSARKCV